MHFSIFFSRPFQLIISWIIVRHLAVHTDHYWQKDGMVMRSVLAGQLIRVTSQSLPRSYCCTLPPLTFCHNDGLMDYLSSCLKLNVSPISFLGSAVWFMNRFPPLKYHYFQSFQFHWYGWWRRFLITGAHSEREQ